MAPQNLFGVLTVLSFLWALPCALIIEGPTALATWTAATALQPAGHILRYTVSTGLFSYLYNEVAKLALSKVNPADARGGQHAQAHRHPPGVRDRRLLPLLDGQGPREVARQGRRQGYRQGTGH